MRSKLGLLLFLSALLVIGGCGGSGSDQMSSQSLDFVLLQTVDDLHIQGFVFNDLNDNGVWNTGEPGVPSVDVSLVGVSDTVTDSMGMYAFGVSAAMAYTVQISPPAGFTPTTPTAFAVPVPDSDVTVDFGLKSEATTYSIFGFVYDDMDGSETMDTGEPGIPNVVVTLDGISSGMTGMNGYYAFAVADTGTYTVVETDPEGYASTTPNEVDGTVVDSNVQIDFGDWLIQDINVDVKPGSDVNPLNLRSRGVLPVAILGSGDFDVMDIDPTTISLNDVAPLRWSYEDVCGSDDMTQDVDDNDGELPDGYVDLTLKFSTQAIVDTLGDVARGDVVTLTMKGELFDGRPAMGEETVWIVQVPKE